MRKIENYSARFKIISPEQPQPQPNQNAAKFLQKKIDKRSLIKLPLVGSKIFLFEHFFDLNGAIKL